MKEDISGKICTLTIIAMSSAIIFMYFAIIAKSIVLDLLKLF